MLVKRHAVCGARYAAEITLVMAPKIRMSDLRVDFKVTRSKFLMIFLLVLLISSIYVVLFYVRKRVKYWIIDIS